MKASRAGEGKIAFNIYDSTHKLLRALSEAQGKPMIVLLKELVQKEFDATAHENTRHRGR